MRHGWAIPYLALFLVFGSLVVGSSVRAAGAEPVPDDSFEAWSEQISETLEDLRLSTRLRDRLAMLRELAEHIREPVEPRPRYIRELRTLFSSAPSGILLNTLIHSLVDEGSPEALSVLLEVLDRHDFRGLDRRPLADGEIEIRHRTVEVNLMILGDRMYRRRVLGEEDSGVLELDSARTTALEKELAGKNERRVRAAAYLLGGGGISASAPQILESLRKQKDAWTRAILLEALGRTDPQRARDEVLAAAGGKGVEKLAAIPILGLLSGDEVEERLTNAASDKRWFVRRAVVEACLQRRDTFAADLLFKRYPDETKRLQYDIYRALLDLTGGVLPPDPKEWARWWPQARKSFRAEKRGSRLKQGKTTELVNDQRYFGLEVWSNQLAILFDVSGSMATTNIGLGLSGVGVEGTTKKGSPMALAKEQIARLLKVFNRQTRFNLIAYNDKISALGKKISPASKGNVSKASRFLQKVAAKGETNTFGALAIALKDPEVDTIFLLSDGEPTRGLRTEPADILEHIARYNRFRQTRLNTVQIGPDLELMKLLAKYSDGRYKNVGTKPTKEGQKPAKVN